MDDERNRLQQLRQQNQRRLQVLEQQAATYGPNVPPEKQIEIEDLRTTLAGIDAQLGALVALRLPEPVPDFVGRADVIERLAQALRAANGQAAISSVRGLGGIGKTQLAYTVAQRVAADFPDGQILLELGGAGDDPMTPNLAIQTVIRAFDRAAQLPDDLGQLKAFYASALAGKRVLVLADDARDDAQVEPLQPPRGCALLITSRRHFTLPGLRLEDSIDLGVLPAHEAEKLLLEISPRIGEHAATLAKLCGCLPLALRVSASVLANDATLPVARYLDQLERQRLALLRDPDDPDNPNADVEASLRLSYDALDPAAQNVLAQLSIFAPPFDLAAAEAVVALTPNPSPAAAGEESNALPPSTTMPRNTHLPSPVAMGEGRGVRDLLGLLYRRSLLEWDAEKERYRVHDLVRAFGAAQLEDGVAVWERYARYYARVARRADELYYQGGEAVLAGLALFDSERAHIDAGWFWIRQGESSAKDKLLWDYAYAVTDIGLLRYDLQLEQIPYLEAALAVARRQGDRDAEGAWLGNLGIAYADLGEARRAIEFYEQALAIDREIGDRRGEGADLGNLGIAYADLGEARRAIEFYEQYLAVAREIGDQRGEGADLGNLGNAYADLGEARRAIEYHEQALMIDREIGDRRGEGADLGNLGNAYADLGEARRAIEFYEQNLVVAREIGDRRGVLASLGNLGVSYYNLGEARRAIDFYEQYLVVAREIGDRRGEANSLYNTSLALDSLGRRAEAIAQAEAALTIYEQIESPFAERVRQKLAEWRAAAAKWGRKRRKWWGGAT
jgi:tetratricopeptide (TPR) repeat protein